MPPHYTLITLQEMTQHIEPLGFEFYNDPKAQEYVFQKYLKEKNIEYTLRVYTSISKYNDDSRTVGTDAIRLVVLGDNKYFGEGRVNRTQNWRDNLTARINKWNQVYTVCPQCGHALRPKQGKYGEFMGCVTFPACGYTQKKER